MNVYYTRCIGFYDDIFSSRRSLQAQMEAQKKKDTTRTTAKRAQINFAVTIHALKVCKELVCVRFYGTKIINQYSNSL